VRGTVRGTEPDPLFLAVNKGGRIIYGHRLSTTAVYAAAVKRQLAAAGVGRFSPHDLRRTIAGDWIDAGADIASVQQLLGHARVETTLRYDRRPEAARRKAASLVAVPYVEPTKGSKTDQVADP
jgi:integrase